MMCKVEDFMHQAYKKAAVLAIATLLGWGGYTPIIAIPMT